MWWKRWNYLLATMERETQQRLTQLVFDHHRALLANSALSGEQFSKLQNEVKSVFNSLERLAKPWLEKVEEGKVKKMETDFYADWQRVAGFDPRDKEAVAAWGKELVAAAAKPEQDRQNAAIAEAERIRLFEQRTEEIKQKRLNSRRRK